MTYAIASINTDNYQDLADLTDAPKREYCERYGYKFFVLKEAKYSPVMGFNKIHFSLEILNENPDVEWLLFSECDATITNLTIPMSDKINNDYHVILPVDVNNINAGNFLVRNSPEGRAYLQMIIDSEELYATHEWAEQQAMIETIQDYSDTVLLVYQRYMNSYQPEAYDYADVSKDLFGNSGTWEQGDWIVHWPGLHKPIRMHLAKEMLTKVVR
jgi:hypothetical protein